MSRKRKIVIILLSLMIMIAVVFGGFWYFNENYTIQPRNRTIQDTQALNHYSDNNLDVSFDYPEGWKTSTNSQGNNHFIELTNDKNDMVIVKVVAGSTFDLEKEKGPYFAPCRNTTSEEITIYGLRAEVARAEYLLDSTEESGEIYDKELTSIIFAKKDKVYLVYSYSELENYIKSISDSIARK